MKRGLGVAPIVRDSIACGWTSERTFEPYSVEWFERAAEYLEGDAVDLGSIGAEEPVGETAGQVGSAEGHGSDLDR